jgi:hypothetical protein
MKPQWDQQNAAHSGRRVLQISDARTPRRLNDPIVEVAGRGGSLPRPAVVDA